MAKNYIDLNLWLERLELLQARLKSSKSIRSIQSWMQNFAEGDFESAYELLLFLEYIPSDELQARFDELLKSILNKIGKHESVLIVPYGKFGKSGSAMGYPIKNTRAFNENSERIDLTFDHANIRTQPKTVVVFIDDFIGSGETFEKQYNKGQGGKKSLREWADENGIEKRFVMASIIMHQGKKFINDKCGSNVVVIGEVRHKAFDPKLSVFNALRRRKSLLKFNLKYAEKIHDQPLGYSDSESLIAFSHTTPDNTLPIFWADAKKWFPIYPRNYYKRIDQARKLKKDVSFTLGVMNRLGLDLYDQDASIFVSGKRIIKYNHREDHSLVLYIKLKLERLDKITIAQIIGITVVELTGIIQFGYEKKLLDKDGNITTDGESFYKGLMQKTQSSRFRSSKPENFELKRDLYMPKTFKGAP